MPESRAWSGPKPKQGLERSKANTKPTVTVKAGQGKAMGHRATTQGQEQTASRSRLQSSKIQDKLLLTTTPNKTGRPSN